MEVEIKGYNDHHIDAVVKNKDGYVPCCLLFLIMLFLCVREANQAAHSYAKFAILQEESFLWDAQPPPFLVHSLRTYYNNVFLS